MEKINQASDNAKVVLSLIQAINDEDFETARRFAQDEMTFDGVMGSRRGADAYFDDMTKMKLKYDVQKVFVDQEDVCVWYNLDMGGKNIFGSAWYHLENGKVSSLQVVFDPRPLL
ncbi:nuclear transport factor 2 family protein [Chitinophaga arvensicola]|uniref:SnoaL-like domain-containing protein n=1 Tax=Chitinophaga arvensicola TaxID=29529 RepID=A0A1I0REB5_9BACT|nr:nuclear transport factor 2 family protein [Chitinophaga arvensicola]SEW39204.1 SnoaL-like domain-containing protein [Chitinophaga arvensicola]